MSDKKENNAPSPEEMALKAQQDAMRAAREQVQAIYGDITGLQMPDITEAQQQLREEVSAIPGVAEAYAYQAEMMRQAGIEPEALQAAYLQNIGAASQMMRQVMEGLVPEDGYEDYMGQDDDWEILRKEDNALSDERNRLLAFGAPLCIYNGDYVNSIESTTDQETLADMLAEWWEVTDRETALETIGWLLEEGQHAGADPALAEISARGMAGISEDEKNDDGNKMGDVYAIAEFALATGALSVGSLPKTVLGWDLVRAVNVARWTFLCGYIGEDEMWQAMQDAVDMAKRTFCSWEEYGLSFAVGRGVWRGDTDDYETAYEVVAVLLGQEESPWRQVEW